MSGSALQPAFCYKRDKPVKGTDMFPHQYYDLGHQVQGTTLQVALSGNSANVRLLDATNYQRYKSGKRYKYWGGHALRSPVTFTTPHTGHWYVVIDRGGYAGRVTSTVTIH